MCCAILRSRVQWELHAGKSSRYFLNLEKQNFQKKTIHRLQLKDGTVTSDPVLIRKEQFNFYKNLYHTSGPINENYLNSFDTPKINEETRNYLDSPITLEEIACAVKQLNNNKMSGCDGIPIEFYKVMWPKLKDFLFKLYTEVIEDKLLHLSARRGVISLLEKLEKNPLFLESWRPLSLLNSDYKIFAKILANRLQYALPDLIHESQTGFMKNRFIGENILKLMNLMEYCDRNQESGIVLSIDFMKAFNRLEWPAILTTFKKFGIGD